MQVDLLAMTYSNISSSNTERNSDKIFILSIVMFYGEILN